MISKPSFQHLNKKFPSHELPQNKISKNNVRGELHKMLSSTLILLHQSHCYIHCFDAVQVLWSGTRRDKTGKILKIIGRNADIAPTIFLGLNFQLFL